MSIGGSASSSKQKGSSTSVSQPNNPAWSQNLVMGLADSASGVLKNNLHDYHSGANPMQTQAADALAGMGGGASFGGGAYQEALGSLRKVVDGRDDYYSPYTDQVVDASLADFDADAGRQRAALSLKQAGQGAFGGSGTAIENSLLGGELARGRATLDAGLRDQAFNTGSTLGLQAQGQKMNAAQLISQLGLATDASSQNQQQIDLQRLLQQFNMGEGMRQIDQEGRQTPISVLERLAGIASGTPLGLFQGMTETGTYKGSGSSVGVEGKYNFK
jgi:hypothetical protein